MKDFYELDAYRRCDGSRLAQTHKISLGLVDINRKDIILEVGSGAGALLREIAKREPITVGFDLSSVQVRYAKTNAMDASCMIADAENLPFRSNVFTKCFAIEILEHVPNPKRLMNEIHRVLDNECELIIAVPNDRNWFVYRLFQGHLQEAFYDYGHKHDFSSINKLKPFIESFYVLAVRENKKSIIPLFRIATLLFPWSVSIREKLHKCSLPPRLTLHLIMKLKSKLHPP